MKHHDNIPNISKPNNKDITSNFKRIDERHTNNLLKDTIDLYNNKDNTSI